ncbi:MAG: hypothetical protein ABIU58_01905 [Ramlibacter sp.]
MEAHRMTAMDWTPLPKGSFTGIDWSADGASTGHDPYLIWAETDQFAGYGLKRRPDWMPLLIELTPGTTVQQLVSASSKDWLCVPGVYTSGVAPRGFRYCTARVRPRFFKAIQAGGRLHALVGRVELGLPAGQHADGPTGVVKFAPPGDGALLRGKVLGLIDGGLAFAHANFRSGLRTRIKHFWRQDRKGFGPEPAGFGYGHELIAAGIDEVMRRNVFGGLVDETRVYQVLHAGRELDKRLNHGTHVLDVACGPRTVAASIANLPPSFDAPPSWAPAGDDASRCDIVAVQLDWATVLDTSGGSMNVHIMDGLMYILSRCARSARVTVNLSWGTLAGPHDGSSVLEAAMDELIDLEQGRLGIVLPASNSYQARTHSNTTLGKGRQAEFQWQCKPDDNTQNFLELWLPRGARGVSVQLTPPGHAPLPPLEWGESGSWNDAQGSPRCAVIYPRSVAIGANGTCALIAVAPTFAFDPLRATAPSGSWRVRLANSARNRVTLDAYIERDDQVIGVRTGARQSNFEDRWYDTSGNPGSFVDHAENRTLIRRSGSFNSIATGTRTLSVGGTRVSGPQWALYSPQNPDPVPKRRRRPGVVMVPGLDAPSDENGVLLGVNAAGTRSAGVVRMVGTSDSAPQITRTIFNAL